MATVKMKKVGRPKTRRTLVYLHVGISTSVNRLFRRHIGPNRILCKEIERALLEDVRRANERRGA